MSEKPSNAALIAELQAVALAVRMFGLEALSTGNVTLAGARHPVASDGEGAAGSDLNQDNQSPEAPQ